MVNRLIASPGNKLDAILQTDSIGAQRTQSAEESRNRIADSLLAMLTVLTGHAPAQSSLTNCAEHCDHVALSAFEAEGPKEERVIQIPARKKSHLVGLRGQTIELVQRTAGVLKCHIMVDRDKYEYDKDGQIPLQVCGSRERVNTCVNIINGIINGDYSGIGHTCSVIPIEQNRVNYLRGDRWQVINYLKDLTGCYLDVIQGPPYGLARGEAQLFMTGPPERVSRAKAIIDAMLSNMDKIALPDINVDAPWRREDGAVKGRSDDDDRSARS